MTSIGNVSHPACDADEARPVCANSAAESYAPPAGFSPSPLLSGHDTQDVDWLSEARRLLDWETAPKRGFEGDFAAGDIRWFADGRLSVTRNCVFRHPPGRPALLWDPDEPSKEPGRVLTYGELGVLVRRVAAMLVSEGVRPADVVTIYMPMVPETVAAMLACAHIGAVHSVVFAGFSSEALAGRIADARSSVVLTADEAVRGGRHIGLKAIVDGALDHFLAEEPGAKRARHSAGSPEPPSDEVASPVRRVIVFRRTGRHVPMAAGRDVYWDDVLPDPPADQSQKSDKVGESPAGPCDHGESAHGAEDPLFVLYTSGSTGKPKGLVHTRGGYLLYALRTALRSFALDPSGGDVMGCLADVGWITGHTYAVYGPLAAGATTVIFEGTPTYPDASRYWDTAARLGITQLYTAPTVVRALQKAGDAFVLPLRERVLRTVRLLGTVGEPIGPDAWRWYRNVVGGARCPVVDTYWQTETGGHVVAPDPARDATVPGAAMRPLPGIALSVLDASSGAVIRALGWDGAVKASESGSTHDELDLEMPSPDIAGAASGVLAISRPWPGVARTIWGDHARFVATYFAPYRGHYFTGDRADVDAGDSVWIRGRVDDVINVSGHRLGTAEIEGVLGRHARCAEAAVLGRPDPITGQAIWAFVVLKGDARSDDHAALEREMVLLVRAAIGPFAAPRRVIVVSDLPKTRSGKIMRRLLRKILEGARDTAELGDTTTLLNAAVLDEIIAKVHS